MSLHSLHEEKSLVSSINSCQTSSDDFNRRDKMRDLLMNGYKKIKSSSNINDSVTPLSSQHTSSNRHSIAAFNYQNDCKPRNQYDDDDTSIRERENTYNMNKYKDEHETMDQHTKMKKYTTHEKNNIIKQVNYPRNLVGKLPKSEIQQLFVEMCFFARLGFLQPPFCLHCAFRSRNTNNSDWDVNVSGDSSHKESHYQDEVNMKCRNLLIWRINANSTHLLHPDLLDGNIVVVTCSTAQAWLRGEAVQKMRWDRHAKRLLPGK